MLCIFIFLIPNEVKHLFTYVVTVWIYSAIYLSKIPSCAHPFYPLGLYFCGLFFMLTCKSVLYVLSPFSGITSTTLFHCGLSCHCLKDTPLSYCRFCPILRHEDIILSFLIRALLFSWFTFRFWGMMWDGAVLFFPYVKIQFAQHYLLEGQLSLYSMAVAPFDNRFVSAVSPLSRLSAVLSLHQHHCCYNWICITCWSLVVWPFQCCSPSRKWP